MQAGIPTPKYAPKTADTIMRPVLVVISTISGINEKIIPANIHIRIKKNLRLILSIRMAPKIAEIAIPIKLIPHTARDSIGGKSIVLITSRKTLKA
jgi:hypothetical protein